MADLSRLQRTLEEASRKFMEAQAQADAEQRVVDANNRKAAGSSKEVLRYLGQLVERQLVTGRMYPKVVKEYLKRFQGDSVDEYLRILVSMLTNEFTGITSDSSQIACSKFTWFNQEYTLESLQDYIVKVLGALPLPGNWWLYTLLTEAVNNRAELRQEFASASTRARMVSIATIMSKLQLPIKPDNSILTYDDLMLIECVVDGKGYTDMLN